MSEKEYDLFKGNKSYGATARLFQIASGIFLIFFVGVHLYVAHIDFGHPVVFFSSVVNNLGNPFWLAFFVAFIWVISYHALNGIGGILKDIRGARKFEKQIDIALAVAVVITGVYGTLLTIIVSRLVP